MTTIEIIALIALLVFILIAVFLIIFFVRLQKTLCNIDQVLKNVHCFTDDLNTKMECVQPLFRSISNVGEGLEFRTNSFRNEAFYKSLSENLEKQCKNNCSGLDIIDSALLGMRLWKNLRGK